MPASKETREYVEKELPYKILMHEYRNSRSSLRELGKSLGISYHVVQSVLKQLEVRHQIKYTLELDEAKLGFAEGRIITIRFGIKPGIDFIKERIGRDIFIQDAYLTEGDFDLLLYAVGLSQADFQRWQWNLRVSLSSFKPTLKFASVSGKVVGFLPLRNALIRESEVLSTTEKDILEMLNDNSRARLSEMTKKLKISPNRVVYVIKKLQKMGIIKRFSALSQTSDKKTIAAFGISLMPTSAHVNLVNRFASELLKEELHESANDYCLIVDSNGYYDAFDICLFENGESLLKKGSELILNSFAEEEIRLEKAIITGVLVGQLPLHLENYYKYKTHDSQG